MSLAEQQWSPTSVQVTVLQARGLRVKGKSGTNDAYAVMQVGKEKFQTSVAEKTVAPVWKEEATFDLPPQHGAGGGLHVNVLHRALVGPDKLLGQAVINLLQLSEDETRNKTEWFKLLDKTGKLDKDRGEVLVDIQFLRNNMTASMFDLSAAGKSRSRLGKFKDKVRGKKKDTSDTSSNVVPAFTQVLTDSEEEGHGDGEVPAGQDEKKKKKLKMKSLFSPKSNLQKNMSQSMSVLPAKNSSLSGSLSSGLNVDASEGKKKFKFKIHKRTGSSDAKDSSAHQKHAAADQSNVCINGSHVYCEEPQPRTSRIGSNYSLASSGHGSMEDVPDSSPPSVDSLRAVRQYSPWTEEEEEEEAAAGKHTQDEEEELRRREEEEKKRREEAEEEERRAEEERMEEERRRKEEEEFEKLAEEKRRQEEKERRLEEDRVRRQEEELKRLAEEEEEEEERRAEEERVKREEEERMEDERRRKEEEEERIRRAEEDRVGRQEEEIRRFAEEKRREEEERRRIEEEERKRREEEERARREELGRLAEEKRRQKEEERQKIEEEERIRLEREREEERARRLEEEWKLEEEKKRLEEEERQKIEEEERQRREEEETIRLEREREEEEEERARRLEEEWKLEEEKRLEEEERRRIKEEEARQEEEEMTRRQEEEEKKRLEEQERARRRREEEERIRKEEEEERVRQEKEEYERLERERRKQEEEEERKRREEEERIRKEKEEYERMVEEKMRLERRRIEEEERARKEEQERMEKERRRKEEEEEKARKETERLAEEKRRQEEERQREEEGRALKRRREEEERMKEKEEEEARRLEKEKLEASSTNPFDENYSHNPFEENLSSPAEPDRCRSVASTSDKDLISSQRGRRAAPQPPGSTQAERQTPREQDGSATSHLATRNEPRQDKDAKTGSLIPKRSVKQLPPVKGSENTQSSTQKSTTSAAKPGKRLAPQRPGSVESESNLAQAPNGKTTKAKQEPAVYGLNPFEEDDEGHELATKDETVIKSRSGSVQWPLPAEKDAASQTKVKSSKMAPAPPLPVVKTDTTSPSATQSTKGGLVTGDTDRTTPETDETEGPESQIVSPVRVKEASQQETQHATVQPAAEEAGGKEAPPPAPRRLQPVKPLSPLEQPSVPAVQRENNGIICEVPEKTKVNDTGTKGPYSQLTKQELISMVLKQENKLTERERKISELEQYIDNLLVRVIEEAPTILMSLNSVKKPV